MIYLRLALKLGPWIAIAILSLLLTLAHGELRRAKAQAKLDLAQRHLDDATARLVDTQRLSVALAGYAGRQSSLRPIVQRSTETVIRYAQTAAGRVACLGADRVHGLDELDASLARAAPAAVSGPGALQADPGPSPTGRVGDRR